MTGPNPDAELDEALGVAALPPAAVTDAHRELADDLVARYEAAGAIGYEALEEHIAQALADAEQRGAARVIAEHEAAGT